MPTHNPHLSLHDALPILRRTSRFRPIRPMVIPATRMRAASTQSTALMSDATNLAATTTTSAYPLGRGHTPPTGRAGGPGSAGMRSEEHTSELQSRVDLVC